MLEIYPLSNSDNPPKQKIVDISGIRWSQTPPRGIDYWKSLHAIIQREPVHERDRFFMAMLKPLGIEKGKPFEPDERQSRLLTDAALVPRAAPAAVLAMGPSTAAGAELEAPCLAGTRAAVPSPLAAAAAAVPQEEPLAAIVVAGRLGLRRLQSRFL